MTFSPLDSELSGLLFTTDACGVVSAIRSADVDLSGAFDLAPAVAAAARWVDPALRHAAAIRERLVSRDHHATTIE